MKNHLLLYAIAWSVGPWAMSLPAAAEGRTQARETLSDPVMIPPRHGFERKGWPGEMQYVVLSYSQQRELLWITGARLELVGPDGRTPVSAEFVGSSCLTIDDLLLSAQAHNWLFGKAATPLPVQLKPRLLCFSQGNLQTMFPPDFAVPVLSHEPLMVEAAVVNQNHEEPVEVRFKWTVEFSRDQDRREPFRPLFIRGVLADPSVAQTDPYLWTIPPGRDVKRFNVTRQLALPFDTTVHYIRAYLLTFGESLEWRDLTTGTTLFTSRATPFPDRLGLAHIDTFSSEEGIPVYKDHAYELVSTYDNTTAAEVPARAAMRLYLLDKTFQKPAGLKRP